MHSFLSVRLSFQTTGVLLASCLSVLCTGPKMGENVPDQKWEYLMKGNLCHVISPKVCIPVT